jgi:hypothetical protein
MLVVYDVFGDGCHHLLSSGLFSMRNDVLTVVFVRTQSNDHGSPSRLPSLFKPLLIELE